MGELVVTCVWEALFVQSQRGCFCKQLSVAVWQIPAHVFEEVLVE
jgi:hypothetical protein